MFRAMVFRAMVFRAMGKASQEAEWLKKWLKARCGRRPKKVTWSSAATDDD
jgi:hypothetical protein